MKKWKAIHFNMRGKLIFGFFMVSILVLVAGASGVVALKRVTDNANRLIETLIPMKDASMEALIHLESAQGMTWRYQSSAQDLMWMEEGISEHLGKTAQFLMNLSSRSEEVGMDDAVRARIEEVYADFDRFSVLTEALMEAHQRKVAYMFVFKDRLYHVENFMDRIQIGFDRWVNALATAVKYKATFSGVLDIEKSEFGQWYRTFGTMGDSRLNTLLEKTYKRFAKMYPWAEKINATEKKAALFSRLEARYIKPSKRSIGKVQAYISPILKELEGEEEARLKDLSLSALHITESLLPRSRAPTWRPSRPLLRRPV